MKEPRRRADRFAVSVSPDFFTEISTTRGAWYESREEIEAGLEWGEQKTQLLRWTRRQISRRLTVRERRCVELYFFQGLTYLEIGKATGINPSSAFRAVRRSLNKLKRDLKTCSAWQRQQRLKLETGNHTPNEVNNKDE
jgi:RNA polymerase sigma factor (sigma-70 family)